MKHTNDILVIDRDQWARGRHTGPASTYLLNPKDGSMCCLGFDALALGVPECAVRGKVAPRRVGAACYPEHARATRFDTGMSDLVERAIAINDDGDITDAEREAQLIPVLKALGWKAVIFVGGQA